MKYKIEKNIDIKYYPAFKSLAASEYPFFEMEVGDSFICGEYSTKYMRKMSNLARNNPRLKKLGYKFSFRKLLDGNIRCWRVK
jgi:hypothetical protein